MGYPRYAQQRTLPGNPTEGSALNVGLSYGFDIQAPVPVSGREVVKTIFERNSLIYPYKGLETYVEETGEKFRFTKEYSEAVAQMGLANPANNDAFWETVEGYIRVTYAQAAQIRQQYTLKPGRKYWIYGREEKGGGLDGEIIVQAIMPDVFDTKAEIISPILGYNEISVWPMPDVNEYYAVIYDGRLYDFIGDNYLSYPPDQDGNWQLREFDSQNGARFTIDEITYDFISDRITSRRDQQGNFASFSEWQRNQIGNDELNPIRNFRWGDKNVVNTTANGPIGTFMLKAGKVRIENSSFYDFDIEIPGQGLEELIILNCENLIEKVQLLKPDGFNEYLSKLRFENCYGLMAAVKADSTLGADGNYGYFNNMRVKRVRIDGANAELETENVKAKIHIQGNGLTHDFPFESEQQTISSYNYLMLPYFGNELELDPETNGQQLEAISLWVPNGLVKLTCVAEKSITLISRAANNDNGEVYGTIVLDQNKNVTLKGKDEANGIFSEDFIILRKVKKPGIYNGYVYVEEYRSVNGETEGGGEAITQTNPSIKKLVGNISNAYFSAHYDIKIERDATTVIKGYLYGKYQTDNGYAKCIVSIDIVINQVGANSVAEKNNVVETQINGFENSLVTQFYVDEQNEIHYLITWDGGAAMEFDDNSLADLTITTFH